MVTAPANRLDPPLLGETLDSAVETLGGLPNRASINLDCGYHSKATKALLENRGLIGVIFKKGKPDPTVTWETVGRGADQLLAQRT